MNGINWAILAGVGFGLFQLVHRKAGIKIDVFLATFILLSVSALILLGASFLFEDVSLLLDTPIRSLGYFGMAGFIHFFMGWTLLSVSQKQIGAARTGALMGATPLFAAILAVIFLGEVISSIALLGILLIVSGVYVVSTGGEK